MKLQASNPSILFFASLKITSSRRQGYDGLSQDERGKIEVEIKERDLFPALFFIL
jgi:hypothetical protein